jgi:hypothetical protein
MGLSNRHDINRIGCDHGSTGCYLFPCAAIAAPRAPVI